LATHRHVTPPRRAYRLAAAALRREEPAGSRPLHSAACRATPKWLFLSEVGVSEPAADEEHA
jgi:hypothetical protein